MAVELTSDVKNVHCYLDDDKLSFQISFTCGNETWQRIKDKYGLVSNSNDNYYVADFWDKFEWWQDETIQNLEKIYVIPIKGVGGHHTFFWFDENESKLFARRIFL